MERDKILEILKANLETHRTAYEEAWKNYLIAVADTLSEVEAAVADNVVDFSPLLNLPVPKDYSTEYEEAISMFSYTDDLDIQLTQEEFRRYILDKWNWGRGFLASNSAYLTQSTLTTVSKYAD